jgi:protocatechuate 3,4-dioxygenase beta subunit
LVSLVIVDLVILELHRRAVERTVREMVAHEEAQSRRRVVMGLTAGLGLLGAPRWMSAALAPTPRQTAGPFYPDRLPLDTDNDLLRINHADAQAQGEITWVSGRILDLSGRPLRGAQVEIWQVDRNGVYLHSRSGDRERRDADFQGYGRCMTGDDGGYVFRTIKPVPYSFRTAHIHFGVRARGGAQHFTTQMYVKGEPLNARDGLLNSIADPRARESVIVELVPLASRSRELSARFDIVLGVTPEA